jgi:hypothetical protein
MPLRLSNHLSQLFLSVEATPRVLILHEWLAKLQLCGYQSNTFSHELAQMQNQTHSLREGYIREFALKPKLFRPG